MADHQLTVRVDPPANAATGPHLATLSKLDLLAAFYAGRAATTVRSYQADLGHFARHVGIEDVRIAVNLFLGLDAGRANGAALAWRNTMVDAGLASNTINRRLAALRSVVKLARTLGQVGWTLELPSLRTEKYRDVRGPGQEGYRAMVDDLDARATTPKGKRDRAIVRLLRDRALRRGELVSLDLAHYDPAERTVSVMGKGRREREVLAIGKGTAAALDDWIAARGADPGPLFIGLHPGGKYIEPTRLTGEAVRLVVAAVAKRAGVGRVVRPHGLRHQAVTDALDAGHPIRDVQKYSRHRDLNVLTVYDDRRKDVGGEIARVMGDD